MVPAITCRSCGTVSQTMTKFCRYCGARLQHRLLLGTIKWGSWSLATLSWAIFTIHLISIKQCSVVNVSPVEATQAPAPQVNTGVVANSNINGNVSVVINYAPPPPPEKPEEVKTRHFIPKALDDEGKHATFDIYLFSDEYRWQIGRSDMLENGLRSIIFTRQMQENLNKAEDVICVGASSEQIREGISPAQGRREEEVRAAQRAETIARWIRPVLSEHVVVHKLNIGHHAPEEDYRFNYDRTSEQRRVIIVLVLKKEPGVNIDEALRNAFEREKFQHPIYDRILAKYSLTRGERFNWVE